jgi:hypothetical protein
MTIDEGLSPISGTQLIVESRVGTQARVSLVCETAWEAGDN